MYLTPKLILIYSSRKSFVCGKKSNLHIATNFKRLQVCFQKLFSHTLTNMKESQGTSLNYLTVKHMWPKAWHDHTASSRPLEERHFPLQALHSGTIGQFGNLVLQEKVIVIVINDRKSYRLLHNLEALPNQARSSIAFEQLGIWADPKTCRCRPRMAGNCCRALSSTRRAFPRRREWKKPTHRRWCQWCWVG